MKKITLLAVSLLCLLAISKQKAFGQDVRTTETLYLSGTDKDHQVAWQFFCTDGAIIEFDSHGQELHRIDLPGAWGVEELKNGNILGCSNRGFAREFDKKGKVVWEYDWSKNPAYKNISTQKAHRLPNGNTLMNNWFNEWSSQRIDPENPDVQAIEVTPDGRIVWELSSWFPPADLGPATTIQPLNEPVNRSKLYFGDIR